MEIGQKVKIVSCDLHPKFVGKEGIIDSAVIDLYQKTNELWHDDR